MSKVLQILLLVFLTITTIMVGRFALKKATAPEIEQHGTVSEEQCLREPQQDGCEIYIKEEIPETEDNMLITGIESYLYVMIDSLTEEIEASQIFIDKTLFLGDELNPLQTIAQEIISGGLMQRDQLEQWRSLVFSGSEYMSEYLPRMSNTDTLTDIPTLENMYREDIIAHHQESITMSKTLLRIMKEEDKFIRVTEEGMKFRNDVKAFAQRVIDIHTQEIKRLQNEADLSNLSGDMPS